MINNIKILEYSIKNPEKFMDSWYMFIKKHTDLDLHVSKTKKIKEILTSIKTIFLKKGSEKIIEELFIDLHKEIKSGYVNYSEFGSFVNACDSNIDEVKLDMELLREITNLYLKYRDITDITPYEWVQALLDKGASRRKGKAGEKKLIEFLKDSGFILSKNYTDFLKNKLSVAQSNSGGDFSNKGLKKYFGLNLINKKQNKKLDLIIKVNNQFYFLEAKHMNTGGGGQDKQNIEYIDIIRNKPLKSNYHYVSFLDGIYFNKLFMKHKNKNKMSMQENDIRKALLKNKGNYFINTAGFKNLFLS